MKLCHFAKSKLQKWNRRCIGDSRSCFVQIFGDATSEIERIIWITLIIGMIKAISVAGWFPCGCLCYTVVMKSQSRIAVRQEPAGTKNYLQSSSSCSRLHANHFFLISLTTTITLSYRCMYIYMHTYIYI